MQNKTEFSSNNNSILSIQFFVCLVILVAACIIQFHGFYHYLDVLFFDESEYLYKGIIMPKKIYTDWGPSYNLWYRFIFIFTKNPITTYYVNYVLLNTFIPILLFIFLVRNSINKWLSLLLSILLLTNSLLYANFTQVSNFCIVIMLLSFIIISYVKADENKIIVAIAGAYICMYARQEFLLIIALLFLLWCFVIIKQKKIRFSFAYISLIVIIVVLYAIFGLVSFNAQGMDRSLFAFGQHFYVNYCVMIGKFLTLDEFLNLKLFGESKTMFQCLLYDPILFMKHVGMNMLNYTYSLFKIIEGYILPSYLFKYLGKLKHILFVGMIAFFVYHYFKKKSYKSVLNSFKKISITNCIYLIFFICSYFSIFFIFPEKHYIIIQFVWWILLFAYALNPLIEKYLNKNIYYTFFILLLVLMPKANQIAFRHNVVTDYNKQPNLKVINFLNKNNKDKKEKIIFSTEKGITTYVAPNYRELFLESDSLKSYTTNKINAAQFLKNNNVEIIHMTENMQKLIGDTTVLDCDKFIHHPEEVGYYKQVIDTSMKTYLLIRKQ